MALPSQYARVAFNFQDTSGRVWQNIYWYELGGVFPSNYNISTAAAAVDSHIHTPLLATISSDVGYVGLDLRINNAGVTTDQSTYPALVGTAGTGPIPNEVAAVVHWQTFTPGKSGRGRSFLTGFPAAFVGGGRLVSSAVTVFNAFASQLLTAFTDQGISWGLRLYSRKLNQLIPISSYVTDELVGTQRRRRPPR